jgi:hypothetical protein
MSDQHKDKVIALLTRRPDLRITQISDALDIDSSEIEACVSTLVESGDVMAKNLPVQAGGTVMAFRINPSSLAWKAPTMPLVVKPNELTKGERALAFLKENGTSTRSALADAMGIATTSYPSSFLKSQLKSGEIVKEGDMYALGQGKGYVHVPAPDKRVRANHQTPSPTVESPLVTIKSITEKVIKARNTQPKKPAPIANTVVSSMSIGDLQIITWATGNLTVTANDNTVELAPVQAKALTAFIGLMEMTHG